MRGRYPIPSRIRAVIAVVAVMSVQPMSAKRTSLQAGGSPACVAVASRTLIATQTQCLIPRIARPSARIILEQPFNTVAYTPVTRFFLFLFNESLRFNRLCQDVAIRQ
jgi:hypothetical protein